MTPAVWFCAGFGAALLVSSLVVVHLAGALRRLRMRVENFDRERRAWFQWSRDTQAKLDAAQDALDNALANAAHWKDTAEAWET